jgi:hypothetical protein
VQAKAWIRRWLDLQPPAHDSIVEYLESDEPSAEDVYLDTARRHLDVQISAFDVMDTQSTQMFSIGSLALPLTFAVLNLAPERVDLTTWAVWALRAGLAAYILLLVCVVKAGFIRGLQYRPDIAVLRDHSLHLPGIALQRWVANEYQESVAINELMLRQKSLWVGGIKLFVWLEGTLLSAAALAALLSV